MGIEFSNFIRGVFGKSQIRDFKLYVQFKDGSYRQQRLIHRVSSLKNLIKEIERIAKVDKNGEIIEDFAISDFSLDFFDPCIKEFCMIEKFVGLPHILKIRLTRRHNDDLNLSDISALSSQISNSLRLKDGKIEDSEDFDTEKFDLKGLVTLGRRISSGQYGEVFEGQLNQGYRKTSVAVKRIPIEKIEKKKILQEINILIRCVHENLIKCYGYYLTDDNPNYVYIVLDLCTEGNLRDYYLHHKLTRAEKISILYQISKGMEFLHTFPPKGILHRDLKPQNILIKKKNPIKVVITDFGESKKLGVSENTGTMWVGSKEYVAPQVVSMDEENSNYDKTCDIYSFGILSWEIFAERIPYESLRQELSQFQFIKRVHYGKNPIRPNFQRIEESNCPAILGLLMQSCWEKESSLRPSSFHEISSIFEEIIHQTPLSPSPLSTSSTSSSMLSTSSTSLSSSLEERFSPMNLIDRDRSSSSNRRTNQQTVLASSYEFLKKKEKRKQEIAKKRNSDHWQIDKEDIKLEGVEIISTGTYGTVLLGTYHGIKVAVKIIHYEKLQISELDLKEKTITMLKTMKTMKHKHIITCYGGCFSKNCLYIVTEYCSKSLDHIILSSTVSYSSRINFAIQIAIAMQFLHSNNIVHDDLKVENILLTTDESSKDEFSIKIIDFGSSFFKTPSSSSEEESEPSQSQTNENEKTQQKQNNQSSKDENSSKIHSFFNATSATSPSSAGYWILTNSKEIKQEKDVIEYRKKIDIFAFGIVLLEMIGKIRIFQDFNIDFVRFPQKAYQQIIKLADHNCKDSSVLVDSKNHSRNEDLKKISNLILSCISKDSTKTPTWESMLDVLNSIKEKNEKEDMIEMHIF